MTTDEGTLEAIWIKRMKRGPMDPQTRARTVAQHGLEGNANVGLRRQVTIISAEAWARAEAEVGSPIDPAMRRANLMVRGLDLAHTRGRVLRVGACRIEIGGETRPCHRMDEAAPGLRQALDPDWRAGIYGVVLDDAEIAVGEPVVWDE